MEQVPVHSSEVVSTSKTRTSSQYMAEARSLLTGKWGVAVGATAIYLLISMVPSSIKGIGGLIGLAIGGPLMLGYTGFSLQIARSQTPQLSAIFDGFNRFAVALVAYLLFILFVFLWMLLLIVPGVIAVLSYALTFFILADNPDMAAMDALRASKRMMQGNKLRLFYLGLHFIGWALLSVLSMGIGFLWLIPYINVSFARFYEDLKA